jgi:hypothetical protein
MVACNKTEPSQPKLRSMLSFEIVKQVNHKNSHINYDHWWGGTTITLLTSLWLIYWWWWWCGRRILCYYLQPNSRDRILKFFVMHYMCLYSALNKNKKQWPILTLRQLFTTTTYHLFFVLSYDAINAWHA